MKNAIVIGSGIAGLASAIRLANKGFRVKVFEANNYPGGKMTEIVSKGYRFDAGPSLFTLPHLVDELFTESGLKAKDYFNYKKAEVACQYFWEDGHKLTAWADPQRFANEVESEFNIPADQISRYIGRAANIYETTHKVFLERSLHKWKNYFTKEVLIGLIRLHKLHLFKTLNQVNEEELKHPDLVQLFNRFATYNGSSPFQTPGIMSMIPHLEHNIGTFYPEGGIHNITLSLYRLARKLGVEFSFGKKVERILIDNKRAKGVRVNDQEYMAEIVMCNMDVVPAYRQLMPDQKAPEQTLAQARSSSALIFYWGVKKQFSQLGLHNIFFSEDYQTEFEHIFNKGTISDDPTVYINISSKEDSSDAPEGCENWFVMVNVPPDTGQDWDTLISRCRERVIDKISRLLEVRIEDLIEYESVLDPRLIASKTSSYQGALYGAASNNRMAAFLRHPNFSQEISGLYFCGGSVHPGGGIPLALLSAKIASGLIRDI